MTNKPTDAEIIKALECCAIDYCNDCPLANEDIEEIGCDVNIHFVALDLINRLKAENEDLDIKLKHFTEFLAEAEKKNEELKAENERLTINMNAFGLGMIREKERADTAKAEAIKEFAERLKTQRIKPEFPWDDFFVTEGTIDEVLREMEKETEEEDDDT